MAFSQSVIRSQAPVKCGVCETERPIKWKCIDCCNLLCNNCKEKVHPKFQNAKDHQIVNIKDVGHVDVTVEELNINKQYQTELSAVGYMSYCHDHSLWLNSSSEKVLQKVKPERTKVNIISSLNTKIYGMAVTTSNNLLISTEDNKLKQFSCTTGTLTDSVYNMSPLVPTAVYITSDNNVLVGGVNKDYPKPGRRVVILMNQKGDHKRVYEHNQHKQPIFTDPSSICSTSNGNIQVADGLISRKGRVVVLGKGSDIINIYTGDTEINKDIPFKPTDIVTTLTDNAIVADVNTHTLHILNNAGLLMTYYKTRDINIIFPYSLAFSRSGQLYIGCSSEKTSTSKDAKIYDVTISKA